MVVEINVHLQILPTWRVINIQTESVILPWDFFIMVMWA